MIATAIQIDLDVVVPIGIILTAFGGGFIWLMGFLHGIEKHVKGSVEPLKPLTPAQLATCVIGNGEPCPQCGKIGPVIYSKPEVDVSGVLFQACRCTVCNRKWRVNYRPDRAVEIDPPNANREDA